MEYKQNQGGRQNQLASNLVEIIKFLRFDDRYNKDYSKSHIDCEAKNKLLKDLRYYLRQIKIKNIPVPRNIVTNEFYPDFLQKYFTAGDENQFINKTHLNPRKITDLIVINTFKYLFYKFKKAIFISIKNSKLQIFLPFVNANYKNEWGQLLRVPQKYGGNYPKFIEYLYDLQKQKFDSRYIQQDVNRLYANNSLFRYEYPYVEEDTSIELLHDMFSGFCKYLKKHKIILNLDFFVQKRDFPLRRIDKTESYDAIYGPGYQLVSHNYPIYSPIFCYSTTEKHADICIPTWEDYAIASQSEGKFFIDSCKIYNNQLGLQIPWDQKKPVAVFRGSTTGSGVTIETNPRLKLAYLSHIDPQGVLDAKITNWNLRPRIIDSNLEMIEINKKPLEDIYESDSKKYFLTTEQQAQYKYIVNVDGHVQAFRLSFELSLGSVILYTDDSPYYTWFSRALQPWVHYVPIKSNLEDLFEKIEWCQRNDLRCQQIAQNARKFYENFINKEYMFAYLTRLTTLIADIKI